MPIWRFIVVAAGVVLFVKACAPDEPATAASSPRSDPAAEAKARAAEAEAAELRRIGSMSRNELVAHFSLELKTLCERMHPRYNFIQVKHRSGGLYCTHDFYSRYSLSAGDLAPAMAAFINEWRPELQKAGILKVGVQGTGEYASSAWFDVK